MGKGMSRKKKPGSGPEVICTSIAEQWQSGKQMRPAVKGPKPAPIWSGRGGAWRPSGRKACRGKEEEILPQNSLWRNVEQAADAAEGIPDAFGPNQNSPGRKETPLRDPEEVVIGDLIPSLTADPAQVETGRERSRLGDACLEPKSPGKGTQTLSKGTQTEATWAEYEEQPPFFQPGRGPVSLLQLAESSEKVVKQNLKEFFAFLRILVNVPTLFLLELIHFLGKSIIQELAVGLLSALGDQVLEPLLAASFERVLRPLLLFLLHVLCGLRALSLPLLDVVKEACLPAAGVLRAFRLVEVHHHHKDGAAEQV